MKHNLKSQLEAENRDIGIGKSATNQWMGSLLSALDIGPPPHRSYPWQPMVDPLGAAARLAWHQTLPRLSEANRTERRTFGAGHLDVLQALVAGGGWWWVHDFRLKQPFPKRCRWLNESFDNIALSATYNNNNSFSLIYITLTTAEYCCCA